MEKKNRGFQTKDHNGGGGQLAEDNASGPDLKITPIAQDDQGYLRQAVGSQSRSTYCREIHVSPILCLKNGKCCSSIQCIIWTNAWICNPPGPQSDVPCGGGCNRNKCMTMSPPWPAARRSVWRWVVGRRSGTLSRCSPTTPSCRTWPGSTVPTRSGLYTSYFHVNGFCINFSVRTVSVLILSVWTSFCINFSVWTVSVLIFPFERLLFKFFHLNGFCFNFSVWTDSLKFSVWTVSVLIFLFERFLLKIFHLNKFQFSFFRLNGFCFNFCVWTVSVFIFSVWTVSVLQLTLIRKYRNKNNFPFMQLVQTNVGITIIHHEIM